MTARRWMWLLAGVFAAALVGFAWWSEVPEPESCPQDGCRVGYRFEDGGKAPEGWEPFETDDPVVALMDACLTYFMTGGLEGLPTSVQFEGSDVMYVTIEGNEQSMSIMNDPLGQEWGTFRCYNHFAYSEGFHAEVLRWINTRLGTNEMWVNNDHLAFGYDEYWETTFLSDHYDAIVRLGNRPVPQRDVHRYRYDTEMEFMLEIQSNYYGPEYRLAGRHSPITE